MSSKGKGKEVAYGKRKVSAGRSGGEEEESRRKRKNRSVLQFFEDAADDDDDASSGDSDSDIDNYFMEEEPDLDVNTNPWKTQNLPFEPKEEVMEEEEFDKMMEERYKSGARFTTFEEDSYEAKGSIDKNSTEPLTKDPIIWKVKCQVGRERHSTFCLMQKFVDMKSLGKELHIITAFSVDHIKGFFYIEADKQCDINEACTGLTYIYCSRVVPVPSNEVYHLLNVRTKRSEVSKGMWARVKSGKYKGDLAQVVAANNEKRKATVKLIPRIDLQALAAKFGAGVSINRTVIPAPKLISSIELEEFRPLIQYRRDRDTGIGFQILDNMMLKDGYLYKRVNIDSLSCWGVMPTEEELLKFSHSDNNESDDVEWLAQLYGDKKKKKTITNEKGGEKGEGSSGFDLDDGFELYNLVCFRTKDFGLIVGMEKDDRYKILKEAPEGPVVVTVEKRELKNGLLDTKFTALDHHSKTISINDTVKVLRGQYEGKQGIVKQIYRGTIFLYDENETDNGGYLCCKSQMCEKIKHHLDICSEKGGDPCGPSDFGDFISSPKSPESPKKPWLSQERETKSDFNRNNRDGMFSIGQTLRIRVGPLKGYICRVLAVHRLDATVKLDSKQKVLTVKNEHLAEVQKKSSAAITNEHDGSSSFKPFDTSGDWLNGAGTSAEAVGWNAERSSGTGAGDSDQKRDGEDSAWATKATPNQNSSWGAAACSGDNEKETDGAASTAWENNTSTKQNSAWGATGGSDQNLSWGSWDKAPKSGGPSAALRDAGNDSWKKSESWGTGNNVTQGSSGAWDKGKGVAETGSNQPGSWGKKNDASGSEDNSWGKAAEKLNNKDGTDGSNGNWGSSKPDAEDAKGDWGSADGCLKKTVAVNVVESGGWKKADGFSGNQVTNWNNGGSQNQSDGWNKEKVVDGGTSWGKQDGGSSWGKQPGGSSWGGSNIKSGGGASQDDVQDSGWSKKGTLNSDSGGSNQDAGWGKKNDSGFGSGDVTKDSTWGKKSDWNSGSADANQESKKGSWGSGATDAGQDSCWGKKTDSSFASGDATDGSSWGKKGSADAGQDSNWGKKSSWGTDSGQDSGWGKKGGSCSGGDVSGWGKKGNWNSGSGDANQDSSWKPKSNWNSGSGNEDQNNSFSNRGGGSWRGGFGSRDGSDRGGFRGRGRSDRGGYGGRGRSDGGGFGGRWDGDGEGGGYGSRGGYRGRGGDRGVYRGRGGDGDGGGYGSRGGDRGGYRGRGGRGGDGGGGYRGRGGDGDGGGGYRGSGGDRGGFGGRGRRDWNNGSDSCENKSFGWNKEGNQGWSGGASGGGAKTWSQSNADQGSSGGWNKEGNQGWSGGASEGGAKTWSQSNADQGGQSSGGWNNGSISTNEAGGNKWSSDNKEVKESNNDKRNDWGKSSTTVAGGLGNQASSGGNKGAGSGDQAQSNTANDQRSTPASGGWGNQVSSGWNNGAGLGGQAQTNTANEGPSSGWNKSNDGGETTGNQDPWGKPSSSSWGQGSGGSKGGW